MEISVIFTTYNTPEWLEKVLWGYAAQSFKDFEVVIADDGSTSDTAKLIDEMRNKVYFPIKHVWHEDEGFQKCRILNKAIIASQSNYLVFSDGDCIPRKDFLQTHLNKRQPNCFLSGGLIRLPQSLSQNITKQDILSQRAFDRQWLEDNGLPKKVLKNLKLITHSPTARLLNRITPTNASWNGHNASAWRKHILAVNGFDERMGYGAEDREFGERMINSGVKGVQIRYSAVCIHLHHSRSYVNKEDLNHNAKIRKETKWLKKTYTKFGIVKD